MAAHAKEELDKLTEEERQGLADDVDEPDEGGAEGAEAKAAAGGEDAAKADAEKAAADAAAAATAAKAKEEADAAAAKAKADEEAAAAAKEAGAAPAERERAVPRWTAPADAGAKLTELEKRRDELSSKFDDGDLSAKEHLAALRKIDEEERPIREAQLRASLAHDMRVANWADETVPAFLDRHVQYRDNETLFGLLDAEVRRQQVEAANKGENEFAPAILSAAHKAITEAVAGLISSSTPNADTAAAAAGKGADGKDKLVVEKRAAAPPQLGRVPASEANDTDGGAASRLDALAEADPIAFEEAMTKMPQADREAYYNTH